ncbi:MAG: metallophosphoesterase family protein, partial [Phycisphaerae bacterium]|nr:metallophosphoesterase family protein [Phycisphaerae bacterium]
AGTLIVNGDATSTINGYIGSGQITAYGGAGTVNVSYNTPNAGKTTVTATSGVINRKKSPYLLYPGINTQMTVLWQVDATGICNIAWGTSTSYSSGNVNTTEYGSDHQHKYNITGLTPGTKYYYRVTMGSTSRTGSFRAAPASNATSVKFFMYGDTRTRGGSNSSVCAQMISSYSADSAYQTMVLHAGDWVSGDNETAWNNEWYNWSNVIAATANMPFMGCAGNHEGVGTVFEKYHPFPFVAAHYYSYDYGPVHIAVVDQYTAYTVGSTQYNWLENDLNNSTKLWKIIILHQPGWSCGGGAPNTVAVQNIIQPLCVDYDVSIVLCGHNHYYARALVNGVHHLTDGGGGAPLHTPLSGQPYIVTYTQSLAVSKVAISGNTLTCTTVDSDGSTLDTFTINK